MGKTLRELREERGLTQGDMAKIIGISMPNFSKKENGIIRVSLEEAKKMADLFGVKIDDIFFAIKGSKKETKLIKKL